MVADNGRLSLAEVDKAVQELYPQFDNKPALIRAFKAADRTGEGFITRKEFRLLLQGLRYFNAAWARFASLDGDGDRKLVARFAIVAYRHQRRRWLLLPLRFLQPTPLVLRLRKWSLAGTCSHSASFARVRAAFVAGVHERLRCAGNAIISREGRAAVSRNGRRRRWLCALRRVLRVVRKAS